MTLNEKYKRLYNRYGDPMTNHAQFEADWMIYWNTPMWIDTHIPALPNRFYINKDIVVPLETVFNRLISLQAYGEIKTFDGLFNIRYIRGSKTRLSIHSFGLAIDLNAAHNPLGLTREQCIAKGLKPFSKLFNEVWKDSGWSCGADWSRADGMHFEYTAHL